MSDFEGDLNKWFNKEKVFIIDMGIDDYNKVQVLVRESEREKLLQILKVLSLKLKSSVKFKEVTKN